MFCFILFDVCVMLCVRVCVSICCFVVCFLRRLVLRFFVVVGFVCLLMGFSRLSRGLLGFPFLWCFKMADVVCICLS